MYLFISLHLGNQEEFVEQEQVNVMQLCILCSYKGDKVFLFSTNTEPSKNFTRRVGTFSSRVYCPLQQCCVFNLENKDVSSMCN